MVWYQKSKWTTARKTKWGGQQYDSKFESSYAKELSIRKKAGDINDWEAHKTIPLIVNGYHIGDYKIDFVIYHNDETEEYVEVKGFSTAYWRLKWKIFCAMYEDDPNKKLTIVWQKSSHSRLRKIKKIT